MGAKAEIRAELIAFFKSRCANPDLIVDEDSNAKKLCGYATNSFGWRGLSNTINNLSAPVAYRLRVDPSDMDVCSTVADIMAQMRVYASFASVRMVTTSANIRRIARRRKSNTIKDIARLNADLAVERGRERTMSARRLAAAVRRRRP